MQGNIRKGTVLVYTLVLVILGVFMATVVLNVAVELSSRYDESKLEAALVSNMKTKGDLAMKYARELNTSGSGFVDNISCPQNITLSGSTLRTTGINTNIRFLSGSILCLAENAHGGADLKIFFNTDYTDLRFSQFAGSQVLTNSGTLSATFADSDTTNINLGSTAYFSADGIDDNFDSDDCSAFSTGTLLYPDGYTDNDDVSRRMIYGYVLEDSGLYNIFWSNSHTHSYITKNPLNIHPQYVQLGDISNGNIHLDIDTDYRLVLYEINKNIYNESKELIIEKSYFGTGQLANIGYLQNDMTLSPTKNANTYSFDFTAKDYALFIENTTKSGALLYKMKGEDGVTGNGIYLQPLDDSNVSIFGYLSSHVLVDNEGRLTGDTLEVFGLKGSKLCEKNIVPFVNIAPLANVTHTPSTTYGVPPHPTSIINGIKSTTGAYDYEFHSNTGNAFIDFNWDTAKKINSIKIYNRTNSCCRGRLTNAVINFYDINDNLIHTYTLGDTNSLDIVNINLIHILNSLEVKRLRLNTVGGNVLNIREIEILGR